MTSIKNKHVFIIGSGINGLTAAITLARSGLDVTVYEKSNSVGGSCRSSELIEPGFIHDMGAAIHPLAACSPLFLRLPLENYGLKWISPHVSLAHPFDDGTAVILTNKIEETIASFDQKDGESYRKLLAPLVKHGNKLITEILHFPRFSIRHPLILAAFGRYALYSSKAFACRYFKHEHARGFMAGLGAHSVMNLEQNGSMAVGLALLVASYITRWPFPAGGAQHIPDALAEYLKQLGGKIITNYEIRTLDEIQSNSPIFMDVTPRQVLEIVGSKLPESYSQKLNRYKYGPGVFKIDWILNKPIPWTADECRQAGSVHVGGTLEEIVSAEKEVSRGKHPERPFVFLTQPSIFDSSRVKHEKHIAWAYSHVPIYSSTDFTDKIEDQIERFAPGFKESIYARKVTTPNDLEYENPNCIGGDITGGNQSLQRLIRPEFSYRTPVQNVYLCSASTPPGPGVHGLCGVRAAQCLLNNMKYRLL